MKKVASILLTGLVIIQLLSACGSAPASSEESVAEESVEESVSESAEESAEKESEVAEEETTLTDEVFLTNLVTGVEARWTISDKYTESVLSDMDTDDLQWLYGRFVKAELESLGEIEDYTFIDETLKELANTYYEGVKLQEEGLPYIGTDDYKSQAETWELGYYYRTAAMGDIYANYTLNTSENFKRDWEEYIAAAADAKQALEDGTAGQYTETESSGPELEVVGYSVSHFEESTDLSVTVKNNTEVIMCTPTITIGTLDSSGDVLEGFEAQAMVALLPGQTIALNYYGDLGEAKQFFVDESGWMEYEGEIYTLSVGGNISPVSLSDGRENYTEAGKSAVNCIDSSIDNSDSGVDVGLSVESIRMDGDGTCYAEIRNNTGEAVNTVTAHASLMDSNGNILGWSMLQEMVTVNPGQSVTLSSYEDTEGLAYMTVSYVAAYTADDEYLSGYIRTIPQAVGR